MLDKLDFMVRFWQLQARDGSRSARKARGEGRGPEPESLSATERAERMSLLRAMATDERLPEAGPLPHGGRGVPVQIAAPGGFVPGELRAVFADGVVIACAALIQAGQRAAVHVADAVSGLEYALPCVIEWSWPGPTPALGLRVDGCPTRTSFGRMPEPRMWRIALGWLASPQPLSE
jgi:hypothetical protein